MDSLARLGQHSDSEELIHAIKRIDIRPPAGFYKTDDSQIDPAKLWEIAKDKQTPEMVARAVEHSALNLKYASKRQMTREICMDAVSRYGAMLKYVPKKMLDEKICRIAFDQDPTAVLSIPEQYQTLEMWKAAVRTSQWMISSVPEQYLNESVCLSAVSANGMALEQIPEKMKNARICLEAVKQNGLSLEHVPPSKRSSRVCKAAVKSDGMALQFVPQKSIDANLIQDAVSSSGSSLQFLPTNRRTRTRCELAINNDPRALEYVPDKFKTEELCSSILNCYPALIRFVPESLRTPQRCQTAVESSWDLLSYVPEEAKSVDICICAFNQNWRALRYFPATMFTQETLVEALSRAKEEIEDSEFGRESIRKSVVEVCAICPHEILDTPLIARLEREIGIRKTLSKRFESETKEFVVREMERRPEWLLYERNIEKRFQDFKSFLEYVEYDLDGADLTGYDFKGEETSELNLANAKISLELIGTLSAKMSLYDHIEHLYDDDSEEPPDVSSADTLIHASELDEFDPESQRRIFYISDIHLDHCIANRFRERVPDAEIRDYIRGLVDQLVEERRKYDDRTYQEILVSSFLDRGRSSFSPERVVKGGSADWR